MRPAFFSRRRRYAILLRLPRSGAGLPGLPVIGCGLSPLTPVPQVSAE